MNFRRPSFRSKKLRDSAKHPDARCSICGLENALPYVPLVFAHRNRGGHFGKGMKGDDYNGAILCNVPNEFTAPMPYVHAGGCHGYGDSVGRTDTEFWEAAKDETMRFWMGNGFLGVQ